MEETPMIIIDSIGSTITEIDTTSVPTSDLIAKIRAAVARITPEPRTKHELQLDQFGRPIMMAPRFKDELMIDPESVDMTRFAKSRKAQAEWAKRKAVKDANTAQIKKEISERKRRKKNRRVNASKVLSAWGEF